VLENLQLATFARKDPEGIKRDLDRIFAIFPKASRKKTQKAGT